MKKIKQLEWGLDPYLSRVYAEAQGFEEIGERHRLWYTPQTYGIRYIYQNRDLKAEFPSYSNSRFSIDKSIPLGWGLSFSRFSIDKSTSMGWGLSFEEAKIIAQKHYENMIMSCFEDEES